MKQLLFLLCSLYFGTLLIHSQSDYNLGLLPKLTLTKPIASKTKLVHSIESRQIFYDNTSNPAQTYQYVLTDFTTLFSYKIGSSMSLNGGYLFRIRGNQIVHRSIQQFTVVQSLEGFRFGHRIATDQTFSNTTNPLFRLRYRATLEIPISGLRVDAQEFYIKVNNEYLGIYQDSSGDLELRLMPFLGYELNRNNKIETGLDYRIDNFIQGRSNQDFWWVLSWYTTL
ncbi:DUF2490 domain-containing protein [Aquimarina brevivitae]|uniref:Uncharacterized protein DUF2490 n=1 Tax=Aquimarina brevivitae TaxID=323412 RepID=A0A4Q7P0U3_9FLAO|nr:DUF2490 domain-containing protein [Aquimarina brevivitae]RZS93421.1 uncharacterized protein DUF2490 [Aquimarina brevivitae]